MNGRKKILILNLLCAILFGACQSSESGEKSVVKSGSSEEICHTSPSRDSIAKNQTEDVVESENPSKNGMVFIEGGTFTMGTNDGMAYEAPAHEVALRSFWIDETEVTVAEFEKFVAETNYVTEAEKFGNSGVFDVEKKGWTMLEKANWRSPEGAGSSANAGEPVTQISWNDSDSYAKWAGKRLPTEAEWEYAARGGLKDKLTLGATNFARTENPSLIGGREVFPKKNTVEDGFLKLAPVKSFAPNGYGLYDVAGNVWEWTADWFDENYYAEAQK